MRLAAAWKRWKHISYFIFFVKFLCHDYLIIRSTTQQIWIKCLVYIYKIVCDVFLKKKKIHFTFQLLLLFISRSKVKLLRYELCSVSSTMFTIINIFKISDLLNQILLDKLKYMYFLIIFLSSKAIVHSHFFILIGVR